jgi:hypothetical protein
MESKSGLHVTQMGVKSRCPFSSGNPRRHAHFAVKQRDFYLTQLSSILEPLQEKTEPRQGKNINPPTMISKLFIVMTAVVVAVNAQGNSTSTSTAAIALQVQLQALTPAP